MLDGWVFILTGCPLGFSCESFDCDIAFGIVASAVLIFGTLLVGFGICSALVVASLVVDSGLTTISLGFVDASTCCLTRVAITDGGLNPLFGTVFEAVVDVVVMVVALEVFVLVLVEEVMEVGADSGVVGFRFFV